MSTKRFQDQKYLLSEFSKEVVVHCIKCNKKALATVNYEKNEAKLICEYCGLNKIKTTELKITGILSQWKLPAHQYFNAKIWLSYPFKDEEFWAFNYKHLDYLMRFIAAELRERPDRTHFTLLEKLPKFYSDAKNRTALIRLIEKLKLK